MSNQTSESGITLAAAKFIHQLIVDLHKSGNETININIIDLINEHHLWVADEWSHLGYCLVVCLNNSKLVDSYNKNNQKMLDALIGKTMKLSNMTVDPKLIQELMPLVIHKYFMNQSLEK